jgi:hypothetical protein
VASGRMGRVESAWAKLFLCLARVRTCLIGCGCYLRVRLAGLLMCACEGVGEYDVICMAMYLIHRSRSMFPPACAD